MSTDQHVIGETPEPPLKPGFGQELQFFRRAIPQIILFFTFLSIPLTTAQDLDLSTRVTTSWILTLYGLSGLLSLIFTLYFRQPILLTGNIFVLIFVASLGGQIPYAELIGASMLAGFIVIPITVFGLTGRLLQWIPAPIVFGLLAGAILPLMTGVFTSIEEAPVLAGGTFLAYIAARFVLRNHQAAITPTLITGLVLTLLTSSFGTASEASALPVPTLTMPEFTLQTIAAITPIFVVLITLQANLPAIVYMRTQGYQPPARLINLTSGLGTFIGALMGPMGLSLSLVTTSVVGGPDAGAREYRYRVAMYAGIVALLIGLLAGFAAVLPQILPLAVLRTLAGLALLGVFTSALQEMVRGPLLVGPIMTFIIVASQISFLGFDSTFWALVVGTGMTFLLERDAHKALNEKARHNVD